MTERAQDVLARLRALPPEERRAVLELVDEGSDDDWHPSPERLAEIMRRARGALDGSAPGVPLEQAHVALREALGLPPSP